LSTNTYDWKALKMKAIANITKAINLQKLSMERIMVCSFRYGVKTLEETLEEMKKETEYGKEQILIWSRSEEEIERERKSLCSKA